MTTAAELEEQEEVRWGKRTQQMAHLISRAMTADHSKSVTLQQLLHHNNRKQAASKFYTMLVLKKAHAVEVRQAEMFGEITISQGSRFDQVMVWRMCIRIIVLLLAPLSQLLQRRVGDNAYASSGALYLCMYAFMQIGSSSRTLCCYGDDVLC